MKRKIHSVRLGLAGVLVASSLGCEAPPEGNAPATSESGESAVLDTSDSPMLGPYLVKQYNDCRGSVQSAIWLCFARSPSEYHRVTCPIGDASYVAVGGGAEIRDSNGSHPGAFVIDAQVPVPTNPAGFAWDRYRAASRSHLQSHPHTLYTYVIGLKIAGATRQQIVDNLAVHRASAGPSTAPEVWRKVPSDRVLLSVNANLQWGAHSGVGQVLAGLWAGGETGDWAAKTTSLGQPYATRLDVHAISLPSAIAGRRLWGFEKQVNANANSGIKDLSLQAPRMAVTHIGAWDYGPARALQAFAPVLDGGWSVRSRSKDHLQSGAGSAFLVATGIGEPSTPNCNPPL